MRNDAVKVLLYLLGAVLLGMLMLPVLHSLGSAAREITHEKLTNFLLLGFSRFSESATLVEFFRCSVAVSALILLPSLLKGLTTKSASMPVQRRPWQLLLFPTDTASSLRGGLRANPRKVRDFLTGFLLAAAFLVTAIGFAMHGGSLSGKTAIDWSQLATSCLWALLVALITEILLRGILLGFLLRSLPAFTAVFLVALLGAVAHDWQRPITWVDPPVVGLDAGWLVLKAMFAQAADMQGLCGSFIPVLVFGMVLGFARQRSASLYASCGLHAAGSLAFAAIPFLFTSQMGNPAESLFRIAGHTPIQGALAITAAVAAGMVVLIFTQRRTYEEF
jgi:membrane protease YdiL (CAAX protease family)